MAKLIVLVEVGHSHDECLLTQMMAIKEAGYQCTLVCTQDIPDRNPAFKRWVDNFFIISDQRGDRFSEMRRTMKHIKKQKAERVVLNTAQGTLARNLCLLGLFSKVEFIGIIHTLLKLEGSFTQKVISWKVKKYFVLSEFLYSKIPAKQQRQFGYFYPIAFDGAKDDKAPHEGTIITIIGGVERRRKDLEGFLQMVKKDASTHFYFLGKSDKNDQNVQAFINGLEENGLREQVTLFNEFVSQETFSEVLNKTDFILPLIHPNTPSAKEYFNNQITGAMTVSFGYKIPMLVHEAYDQIEELKVASVYYSLVNFNEMLASAKESRVDQVAKMCAHESCDEGAQKKRYFSFLMGAK